MTGREAALAVLERCRRDKAWAASTIDAVIREKGLDRREAALASQLSLGVLQNCLLLDFYIGSYTGSKLEPKVRDILRLGIYQILFLDRVPDRAAVSESVSLCRSAKLARASGLVNAVLRRISAEKDTLPEIPESGSEAWLSTKTSHPLWLVHKLVAQRGFAFAEAFLSANNGEAPLEIQINTCRCRVEDYLRALERAGLSYTRPSFPAACVSLPGGRVTELPGYEEGLFYVQDRAACMAIELAAPSPGARVLDLCAAPGGKSFAAAIRMKNRGQILAQDLYEAKIRRLRAGAERLGLSCIKAVCKDAGVDEASYHDRFDLVIADLPCSGIGVIRKRPEIRFRSEEDVASLVELQRSILDRAAAYVRPGGTLLYSTCTVLREENEEQAAAFLSTHPAFEPVDFTVDGRRSDRGSYTFWPQIDGTDGFFVCKMKRVKI